MPCSCRLCRTRHAAFTGVAAIFPANAPAHCWRSKTKLMSLENFAPGRHVVIESKLKACSCLPVRQPLTRRPGSFNAAAPCHRQAQHRPHGPRAKPFWSTDMQVGLIEVTAIVFSSTPDGNRVSSSHYRTTSGARTVTSWVQVPAPGQRPGWQVALQIWPHAGSSRAHGLPQHSSAASAAPPCLRACPTAAYQSLSHSVSAK